MTRQRTYATATELIVMERVAGENEAFAETFAEADTTGDGVPDRNLETVYDALFAAAPDAASEVLHREDGEYRALRMTVTVNPDADEKETTDQLETIAAVLEEDGQSATATGEPVIDGIIQEHLLRTTLTSLLITIVSIVLILAVVYRRVHGSATLGVVTLLPVIATVSWIIGTMHVLGYPLSLVNTIIASLAIGIGIDYSIHVSERFSEELDHDGNIGNAITRTVRGTGAALLGSAATTAAGFGVLTFAVQPSLKQFGLLTAIMIGYAFVVSVFVLPSVLVLWARYSASEATPVVAASDDVETLPSDSPGD
ncbi:MAG: MMPL family transporter [Halobacteriales archaeon]